ncbi:hypothetical protein EVAR_40542_1 [Eumeta japonica]|uniref:Uncharacterized protein n=1 Tax=Eumeta variegata TaxID=151549 RepID=A0A4C1XV05_EUMVA|nr:hypothetical protein EVAR_40542_1 [Eumeta japonica]
MEIGVQYRTSQEGDRYSMEQQWFTGTLTHRKKGNSGSCYCTSVFYDNVRSRDNLANPAARPGARKLGTFRGHRTIYHSMGGKSDLPFRLTARPDFG